VSDPEVAIERAGEDSRTTHAAASCVDACRYLAPPAREADSAPPWTPGPGVTEDIV